MSTDKRRITGPDGALPLMFLQKNEQPKADKILEGKDNAFQEHLKVRDFFISTNIVESSNGSCYLEIDNTTAIIASVYGARPIKGSGIISSGRLSVTCKISPNINELSNFEGIKFEKRQQFLKSQLSADLAESSAGKIENFVTTSSISNYQVSQLEQKLASYIQSSLLPSIMLEKYPKSSIDIFIHILSNDPTVNHNILSLITWSSNCTSLAVATSGIECKDMVCTGLSQANFSSAKNSNNSSLIIDPEFNMFSSSLCSDKSSINAMVSFMNTSGDIVGLIFDSENDTITDQNLDKLIEACRSMALKVRANFNGYLLDNI